MIYYDDDEQPTNQQKNNPDWIIDASSLSSKKERNEMNIAILDKVFIRYFFEGSSQSVYGFWWWWWF